MFKDRILDAVDNVREGDYCAEINKLENHIGSNLGVLLKDLVPKNN